MKSLFILDPLSDNHKSSLVKDYFESRIKSKLEHVNKLSVTHLTLGFEIYLQEKYDLPIKVIASEFMKEIEPLMNSISYHYKGIGPKIRFNQATSDDLCLNDVVKHLHLKHYNTITSHRYFEKM